MADETDNKNFAEKTNEISLRTPSDFCSPSYFNHKNLLQNILCKAFMEIN